MTRGSASLGMGGLLGLVAVLFWVVDLLWGNLLLSGVALPLDPDLLLLVLWADLLLLGADLLLLRADLLLWGVVSLGSWSRLGLIFLSIFF